jgi:hypothetical protein
MIGLDVEGQGRAVPDGRHLFASLRDRAQDEVRRRGLRAGTVKQRAGGKAGGLQQAATCKVCGFVQWGVSHNRSP